MDDSITKFINSIPFFKDFSDHEKNKMINRTNCFVKFSKDDVVFLATGVTDGELVKGIKYSGDYFESETYLLHKSSKTKKIVKSKNKK